MKIKLNVKKYKSEGDLAHEYNPLHNLLDSSGKIQDFITNEIDFNLNKPVDIECQPSYDGTVNLIINDDMNPPRIVNTSYSVIEDNKYRRIVRNQTEQTNLYKEGNIDAQTRLFRNINKIPKVELLSILYHGQLKGGNYTFYFKLADNDFNKTDIVAESGIISIFKGTIEKLYSISGTLEDERTDKSINLQVNNIDTSFSKLFVYYRREYSDLNGVLKIETCFIRQPYKIIGDSLLISIDGYEEVDIINQEELNIKYNICTGVKTQAQVQNMLFFGNVQQTVINNDELQNISYFIETEWGQKEESIGYLKPDNYSKQSKDNIGKVEYYNPLQIYYSLGYWPTELYRIGIVYIFIDDSLSPVYNLRGCKFTENNKFNFKYDKDHPNQYKCLYNENGKVVSIKKEDFFIANNPYLSNTKGVFKFPDVKIINYRDKKINPLYIKFTLNNDVINELSKHKIKGFFFVRQKRIPTILAQGYSIGVDKTSFIPMLYDTNKNKYIAESFISNNKVLTTSYNDRIITTESKQSSGLLCVDATVNKQLQSVFDNSEFLLEGISKFNIVQNPITLRYYYQGEPKISFEPKNNRSIARCIYIPTDTPLKYVDDFGFSTRSGSSEDVKDFKFLNNKNFDKSNTNIVRGVFCAFIGTNQNLTDNTIYNIRVSNYAQTYELNYFKIRGNDLSPFMAISPRYELYDRDLTIEYCKDGKSIEKVIVPNVYRGDCYTATVTVKLNTNFIDSEVPTNDIIVNPDSWKKYYSGYAETSADDWKEINRADINSVPMGQWFTYKCLSNFNLGLRSEDRQNVDEMALMGNPRSFFPLQGATTAPSNKIPESEILNAGYSTTLPFKKYFTQPDVPYIKDIFDTRIMFSNVQVEDDFRNAYRIFQGLSYKDIERQYGAIVKLLSYSTNLFCVFEHGCAIIPVNEKALLSTTTGQSIHMYGAGVLQNQVTPISQDYGSIWQESIIRTPNGIYGVDTYAKKIWRYNMNGFKIISDMIMQRFLNENITLQESDKYPTIALKNVKTHFNNFKGDVMFTFYNGDKVWNICYNERLEKWITKYSWTPLSSENINNIFLSLDRKRAALYGIIYNNINTNSGANIKDRFDPNEQIKLEKEKIELKREKNKLDPNKLEDKDQLAYIISRLSDIDIRLEELKEHFGGSNRSCGNLWEYADVERIIVMKGYEFFDKFKVRITSITSSVLDEHDIEHEVRFIENPETKYDISCQISNAQDLSFSSYTINSNNKKIKIIQDGRDLKLSVNNCEELSKLMYLKINLEITPYIITEEIDPDDGDIDKLNALGNTIEESIVLIRNIEDLSGDNRLNYEKLLRNGFYVHGRAGIFNEINYTDTDLTNEILPTKWYNKQEPFEFEFVVSAPTGLHKIFDNLVIISNNVEPNSLEFEFIGDVYGFNKAGIYKSEHTDKSPYWNIDGQFNQNDYEEERIRNEFPNNSINSNYFNKEQVTIDKDTVTGQYFLKVHQPLQNIKRYGRRIGNIEYKEDRWFTTITPMYYYNKQKIGDDKFHYSELKSTRIRDKWVKIRIKYTGDKLVVISAIQSLMRLSYA